MSVFVALTVVDFTELVVASTVGDRLFADVGNCSARLLLPTFDDCNIETEGVCSRWRIIIYDANISLVNTAHIPCELVECHITMHACVMTWRDVIQWITSRWRTYATWTVRHRDRNCRGWRVTAAECAWNSQLLDMRDVSPYVITYVRTSLCWAPRTDDLRRVAEAFQLTYTSAISAAKTGFFCHTVTYSCCTRCVTHIIIHQLHAVCRSCQNHSLNTELSSKHDPVTSVYGLGYDALFCVWACLLAQIDPNLVSVRANEMIWL
jgi:hypothetical protein